MTIKYSGIVKNGTRCGIITYKNGKEDEKADKVIKAIENEGYNCDRIDCEETTEVYFEIWDKDEFDEIKEIYIEAKRA